MEYPSGMFSLDCYSGDYVLGSKLLLGNPSAKAAAGVNGRVVPLQLTMPTIVLCHGKGVK